MKQTINFSQFCDAFGESYKNSFSYEGKRALFDYLEGGEPLDAFLRQFPSVRRELAVAGLEEAHESLLAGAPPA